MTSYLRTSPFDPAREIATFTENCGDAGGIATFIGRMRSEGGAATALTLEAYGPATEKAIATEIALASERWQLTACHILHRTGTMTPGDPIVLVCTAATHRRSAFLACDYLMDYLKTRAIFWKKETGPEGARWIEPREADYTDSERWDTP